MTHFRKRIADVFELISHIINDEIRARIETLVPFRIDTVTTDATAVPVKIKFPQDTTILNQARLNLESMAVVHVHEQNPSGGGPDCKSLTAVYSADSAGKGKCTR